MSISINAEDQFDLAWKEDVLEINVLEDGDSRSIAIAPPIDALGQDADKSALITGKPGTKEEAPEADFDYATAEYDRLLSRIHEFEGSYIYFSRLANLAKRAGRFEDAANHAEKAAAMSEDNFYRNRLAAALLDVDREYDAEQLMIPLAQDGDVTSALRLAELRIANNDFDGAAQYVTLALQENQLDWRTNMVAGAVALCQASFENAVRFFRLALQDRPRSAILYFNLSLAHHWLGNQFAALRSARKAIALNPFGRNAQLFFADLAIKEGHETDRRLARRFIELFLKVDCDDFIVGRLTHLARESKEQSEAIKIIDLLPKDCISPSIQNNLGVLYADTGKKSNAQVFFRKALLAREKDAEYAEATLAAANLANVYLDAGDYETVEEFTDELLADRDLQELVADEHFSRLLSARLKSLYYQEKLEIAESLIQKILECSDRQPRLDFVIGTLKLCYETTVTGDFNEAFRFGGLALNASEKLTLHRESSNNVALNNYAYTLIELNRLDEAREFVNVLRTDLEDSAFILGTIGLFNIRMGKLDRGESLYRQAAAKAKSKSLQHALLKKMNYELGNVLATTDKKLASKYARTASKIKHAKNLWPARDLDKKVNKLVTELQSTK